MKILVVALFIAVAGFGLALWADEVSATANCQPTAPLANSCRGEAAVGTTTGGTASGRCFFLTARATAPTTAHCTTGGIVTTANQAWEIDAGQCITFKYYDISNGVAPPAVPNKVTILAQYDGLATTIKNWQTNGAEPANGDSFVFCGTTDGNSGSPARAGVVHVSVSAIKDNGNGLPGNTNYAISSTGAGSQDTSFDTGHIRVKTFITSITNNANAAGAAYGTAGDELVTIESTLTPFFADSGLETRFNFILDEATLAVGQAASTVDVDTEPLSQGLVIDSTFPFANNPYIGGTSLVGNSVFLVTHTIFASSGHGANIVRVSDTTAYNSADFSIDSRIVHDIDGVGTYTTADLQCENRLNSAAGAIVANYNRGETGYFACYLFNSRSELLSRSMNFRLEDVSTNVCNVDALLTSSSNKYSTTYFVPTGGSCTTLASDPGSPRYVRTTNTDQNELSDLDHYVSRLYYVDAHPQIGSSITPPTLNKDDFPTEDSLEDLEYFIRGDGMGGDDSDWFHGWCHVKGVRKDVEIDTSGSSIDAILRDSTGTLRENDAGDTGSDGWTPRISVTITSTPLGIWSYECIVGFNGNNGNNVELVEFSVEEGGGTIIVEEVKEQGDPLKVFCNYFFLNDSILCSISESYLDGTARTGNALGTDVYLYDPTGALVVNGDQPTEVQFGGYRYEYSNATEGNWFVLIRTLNETGISIGTSNVFTIDKSLSNHREGSFEFNMNEFLLLGAIAFFVIMGETRKDALYWFFTVILSIYLMLNRSPDSIIPLPMYLGWIFITLYQAVSLLMTKRAQNLSNTEE